MTSQADTAPVTSTYTSALDEYDLNVRNMNTTGNPIMDGELNHMIQQTHRVKEACIAGFAQMDQLTYELNALANKIDDDVAPLVITRDDNMKVELDQLRPKFMKRVGLIKWPAIR